MPNLPFELVVNILSRLPVKLLKRFRCVAKPWRLLIDSGRFVRMHLKTSLETNSHRHLFVGNMKDIFRVDLDDEDRVMANATGVNLPFTRPADNANVSYISNSCNGLFLVLGQPLVIWNPFTKEIKNLPEIGDKDFPPPFGYSLDICYGFGYDSRNDDYKVVRAVSHMSNSEPEFLASWVHIYSLKSNSWRRTAEDHTYVVSGGWATDVSGALHAIAFSDTPDWGPGTPEIIAFSLEREMHYEVKQPLGVSMSSVMEDVCLSKIGGCLSVAYITKSGSGVEIWVMKDYGLPESWTKMLSIPITLTGTNIGDDTVKPLVYSKDGHKVLMYLGSAVNFSSASGKSKGTFLWQDLRNQTAVSVPLKGLPSVHYFDACVESLVPLHAKYVQKEFRVHDKQDKKKIRNKRDDFLSTGFKLVL